MKTNVRILLVVILVLLLPIAVFADNLYPDGDGLHPVANNNSLNLGQICLGESAAGNVLLAIQRSGGGQVYANNATVTVSAGTPTDLAIGVNMPDPSAISLPFNWVGVPNNTMSDSLTSIVSVTGSMLGAGSGSITYSATGARSTSGDLTRTEDLAVSWEVISCAPLDETPPAANPTQNPPVNSHGWNNTDVIISWNWEDEEDGSGIDVDNCTMESQATAEGEYEITATCSDLAGNEGTASYEVKIDKTAPEITWNGGPADEASYYFGFVPGAPTCDAADALSGVNGGCSVSGYAQTVGTHAMEATATDYAGNVVTEIRTYHVLAWELTGFYQPVNMDALNTVKGGSTVPLKFNVYAGDMELTNTSVITSFTTQIITCGGGGVEDPVDVVTTGNTSLRYDTSEGQFIQNWRTPRTPGACILVTMTTEDGSTINANFKMK